MSSSATDLRFPVAASSRPLTVSSSRTIWVIVLILAHAAAAIVFDDYPGLARLHALGCFVLAMGTTLLSNRVERVIYVAAYVVGSEVLWRMASVPLPWEYAKYAVTLPLLIASFRFFPKRLGWFLPTLYFGLLLPSVLISITRFGSLEGIRDAVSFNLSGPLSLAVAALFFRQVTLRTIQVTNVLWAIVVPCAGVAARTLHSIATSDLITFTGESNFQTSGGFGPNQVSAILSLGALCAVLLVLNERRTFLRLVAAGLFFWFTAHSFLTFSRGGIYSLVIAGGLALLASFRTGGRRIRSIALLTVILVVMTAVILPRLESFTGHRLSLRFTSVDPTERTQIASAQLELWKQNPLSGVGPGGATEDLARAEGTEVAAHTEFTRLLAEHGMGGFLALASLLAMAFLAWRRASSSIGEAWTVAFLAWSIAEMTHSAMRIAAAGFCFGLAMMTVSAEKRARQA